VILQCDKARPYCNRCLVGGFECTGYDDSHRVIVYTQGQQAAQQIAQRQTKKQAVNLPTSLQISALMTAHFSSAWSTLHPVAANRARHHGWIVDFPAVYTRESALHSAFSAVALARVGQERGDQVLLEQSSVAYGQALARTSRRFSKADTAVSEESLGCTIMLAMYEVSFRP